MKKTLAFDKRAKQFRCDIGQPPKRLYLGPDANLAQVRKAKLVKLWQVAGSNGWTAELLENANAIRKGEIPRVRMKEGEDEEAYRIRAATVANAVGQIIPTATESDYWEATNSLLQKRIAQLEELVRNNLGQAAVQGPAVGVHEALDAFVKFRTSTELDPDTGKPTEGIKTESNVIRFVKRQVPDIPLSMLSFIEISKWAKSIAARPKSLKTGKPIKRDTVKNCLKKMRVFIKWASQNYKWRKPEDWLEATKVLARRTKEERRAQLERLTKHFTPEEIGILWSHARPLERFLILCGLNFGYAQAEILAMTPADFSADTVAAIRGKSGVFGVWSVWPETRELAATQFEHLPKGRQGISNQWSRLYKRIQKDHPNFKFLSFKWLRKTGSSFIRKNSSGEIASAYLSHGDPFLFATTNAVIDLRTCSSVPPAREQWITIVSPVTYDIAAACPTFERFIADILVNEDGSPSSEMVEYMQRAFGYCLTPSVAEQLFFILWGVGQNGKSTLMDIICGVLGDYAVAGSDTLFFQTQDRSNNEDEARLYGRRLCVTSETKQSSCFSEAKIKKLTGSDKITASFKYQTQFEFKPTHKLFLCCNHKPRFSSDDPAIIRRIKLVPFHYVVPSDKRDNKLPEKLRAEASGILNWMLAGLRGWNDGKTLADEFTPGPMRVAKEEYVIENDSLGEFIEECLEVDPCTSTSKDGIYQSYRGWAERSGKQPLSKNNLGQRLEGRGWQEKRTEDGRFWRGWKLSDHSGYLPVAGG